MMTYVLVLILMSSAMNSVAAADRSKVVLVSMDGFRHDYLNKTRTPNFDRLIAEGVRLPYLNISMITNTFPCHYTMVTGLYSEVHGIVGNTMYDPEFDSFFRKSTVEPKWWEGGEPIWTTAKKAGLKTGTYFWPGSEVLIQGIRPDRWFPYNNSTPFEMRVDVLVRWMSEEDFDLGVIYFNEPDTAGHRLGPDDPQIAPVIERMDSILGLLIDGLEKAGLKDKVNIIVTSDHGMTSLDFQNKVIDIAGYVNSTIYQSMVEQGSTAQIRPQLGKAPELVDALTGAPHMKVWLKENIPEHFHLKNHRRVMPVFALADEGWIIIYNATQWKVSDTKGGHGYDNSLLSMKPIFIAKGPAFKSGVTVDPILSVDIYPLICHLLNIHPAPNNGSLERAATLLKNYSNDSWTARFSIFCIFTALIFSVVHL